MTLQQIENAIRALNPAAFQELGDLFLISKDKSYKAFICTGSQYGKQKTTKGTPDTFIYTKDEEYIMVEYSTDETQREKKLIDDINKCVTKKNIDISKIKEICLFTNFQLNGEETALVFDYAKTLKVKCIIYDGSRLARELFINHKDLIHFQLGVPVDTGQIISLERFIQEYDTASGSIATPLSNPFLYREQELESIQRGMEENDLVLLHGAPGVGKTKLAIQSINLFCNQKVDYHVYCVSFKGGDLLPDLCNCINLNDNNIIFVDDVNRISCFDSIIGFYSSKKSGNIKIIMTVRDYALSLAKKSLYPHRFTTVKVDTMKSEQISEIIKNSYSINNNLYLDKICKIAKGNPRIAMMAGKIAIVKQNLQSLNDVSDLFDIYYGDILNNIKIKNKTLLLKSAGIISVFSPLKYVESETLKSILTSFQIEQFDFIECLDILNKNEIIDLYENIYAKVNEQNLSMYLFYLSFIKEKVLSIDILFKNYYNSHNQRIRDCIIPVNNIFGPDRVEKVVSPVLIDFYNLNEDSTTRYHILSDFWPYLLEETLAYVFDKIHSIPLSSSIAYNFDNRNDCLQLFDNDILELICKLFIISRYELKSALELAFDYVRRRPESASSLLKHVNEQFMYRHYDLEFSHYRQNILLEYIIEQIRLGDVLCKQFFWHVAKLLLAFRTNYSGPSIAKDSYSLYQYPVPAKKSVFDIREKVWYCINDYYSFTEFYRLLSTYYNNSWGDERGLQKFDLPYIINIINQNMCKDNFDDCICVHKYINRARNNGLSKQNYDLLYSLYLCKQYKFYLLLTYDRLKDKDQFLYKNYELYHKHKIQELENNFIYKTKKSYDRFLEKFNELKNNSIINSESLLSSLNYILCLAFNNDVTLGCYLLRKIIKYDYNNFLPYALFYNHLNDKDKARRIYNIIQSSTFRHKCKWIIQYFELIPYSLVTKENLYSLLQAVHDCHERITINLLNLDKLRGVDSIIIDNLLSQIITKNITTNLIQLYDPDFEIVCNSGCTIDTMKKTYLQQMVINNHFDYENKALLKLLSLDPSFLLDYVKVAINENIDPESRLSFIWQISGIESILCEVLYLLRSKNYYSIVIENKWENAFFMSIKKDNEIVKAKKFLLDQFFEAIEDEQWVNQIVAIARGVFNDLYEDLIMNYIEHISNPDLFFKIDWINNHSGISIYGGDTTFGDVEAARWNGLFSILNKINNSKVYYIKSKVKRQIISCKKQADEERLRNFLNE